MLNILNGLFTVFTSTLMKKHDSINGWPYYNSVFIADGLTSVRVSTHCTEHYIDQVITFNGPVLIYELFHVTSWFMFIMVTVLLCLFKAIITPTVVATRGLQQGEHKLVDLHWWEPAFIPFSHQDTLHESLWLCIFHSNTSVSWVEKEAYVS